MKYFFKSFFKRKILIHFLFILITLNIHTGEIKRVFFTKYLFSGQEFNSSVYNGNLLPDSKIKDIKTYVFTSEIIISRTCSIGCAFFPLSEEFPDSISFKKSISISDMALYMAKENGRDQAIIVKLNNKLLKNKDQKRRLSNIRKKILLKDPIFKKKIFT